MRTATSSWPASLLSLVPFLSLGVHVAAQSSTTNAFAAQYTLPTAIDNGLPVLPNIMDPNATDAQTVCPGYTATAVQRTDYGFTAQLNLAGQPCNVYGVDIDALNLTVEYQSDKRLSVNILPTYLDSSNQSFYVLPEYSVPKPHLDADAANTVPENDLGFFWSNTPTFSFSVVRQSTGDVLFSTMGSKLVYEDQFIEFVTALPENYNLYGLPETIHEFRLGNNLTRTLYAADVGDVVDANLYGVHPFYVDTRYYEVDSDTGNLTLVTGNSTNSSAEYTSSSHLVYNRNIHGQDILLRDRNVTWRTIGGSIDLYFFSGPTATEATQQYQQAAAGLPAMQQYWTFGFHQCRWGYENWTVMNEVVDGYLNAGIPLETVWNDIDYMKSYRDFDQDPVRFNASEAQTFMQRLSAAGQHYVPIVDSAIYRPNTMNGSDAYPIWNSGNATNSFMMNPDGSQYIGAVWPGLTVFPDWLPGSGAAQWWTDEMKTWHDSIPGGTFFSGIWIDMSEASSFCVGSCGSNTTLQDLNPVHPPFSLPGEIYDVSYDYPEGFNLTNATEAAAAASASASQSAASVAFYGAASSTTSYYRTTATPGAGRNVNHPPYAINNNAGDLAVHAVSPNATHHDGTLEYDAHSLFGVGILNATYNALLNIFPGERPFIIGRSTTVGAGRVAGHWGGDNYSKFYYMYAAIPQALQFSLAGIPMFGTDTCGFAGNSDYELCSRWMQLSAFFPFYRNHNTLAANSQEAYIWSSVTEATKTAMNVRFHLLPYIYTLFYQAATTGSTVMRALSWEVPNDPSLAAADRQFFLGPAILVSPALETNISSVNAVFPGAGKGEIYYDWYTQARADQVGNVSIAAPLGHIPVFVRGGHILPMQQPAMVTRDARNTPWSVLVALSQQGTAAGSLYLDDGVSFAPNATLYGKMVATGGNRLLASARGNYTDKNALANVTVLGVQSQPTMASFNGMNVSSLMSYNMTSQVLVINGLQNSTGSGAWSQDWILEWS